MQSLLHLIVLVLTIYLLDSYDDEYDDFYHDDEITTYRYSSDPSRLGNFPKELTAYKLESIEDEKYYVDDELLFINTPEWRNLNYFEDL